VRSSRRTRRSHRTCSHAKLRSRGKHDNLGSRELVSLVLTAMQPAARVNRGVAVQQAVVPVVAAIVIRVAAPAGAEESSLDQARSIFETNFC
jgi:hypothetical protein